MSNAVIVDPYPLSPLFFKKSLLHMWWNQKPCSWLNFFQMPWFVFSTPSTFSHSSSLTPFTTITVTSIWRYLYLVPKYNPVLPAVWWWQHHAMWTSISEETGKLDIADGENGWNKIQGDTGWNLLETWPHFTFLQEQRP